MTRLPAYLAFALGLTIGFMAGTALAASADMPIKARIIQCGDRYEALGMCKGGVEECCPFAPVVIEPQDIEPAAGEIEPVEGDDGTMINFE